MVVELSNETKAHLLRRALIDSGVPYKYSDCGCGSE